VSALLNQVLLSTPAWRGVRRGAQIVSRIAARVHYPTHGRSRR
jgi:hypothetical protein